MKPATALSTRWHWGTVAAVSVALLALSCSSAPMEEAPVCTPPIDVEGDRNRGILLSAGSYRVYPSKQPPHAVPLLFTVPDGMVIRFMHGPSSEWEAGYYGYSYEIEDEEGLGRLLVHVLTLDDGVPTGVTAPIDTRWKIHPTIPPPIYAEQVEADKERVRAGFEAIAASFRIDDGTPPCP